MLIVAFLSNNVYLVVGIDLVDAARLGNGPADAQLRNDANIRTMTLWARVTTRPLFSPLIIDRAEIQKKNN